LQIVQVIIFVFYYGITLHRYVMRSHIRYKQGNFPSLNLGEICL